MSDEGCNEIEITESTIRNSPLGEELSPEQCRRLSEIVRPCGLGDGVFLLEEGHQDDALHVVTRGQLEVVRQTGAGDFVSLHLLRPGDMAGEMGFVDGVEHSAGIRAITECEVFTLTRGDLERLIPEDADLVYKVMRAIVRTTHAIVRRMNMQHVELTNYITKQHGRY